MKGNLEVKRSVELEMFVLLFLEKLKSIELHYLPTPQKVQLDHCISQKVNKF